MEWRYERGILDRGSGALVFARNFQRCVWLSGNQRRIANQIGALDSTLDEVLNSAAQFIPGVRPRIDSISETRKSPSACLRPPIRRGDSAHCEQPFKFRTSCGTGCARL